MPEPGFTILIYAPTDALSNAPLEDDGGASPTPNTHVGDKGVACPKGQDPDQHSAIKSATNHDVVVALTLVVIGGV